jgi:malonyl-CoA/methylmalonyl-CoA synthetase
MHADNHLIALLAAPAAKNPQAPFIDDAGRSVARGAFWDEAARMAAALRETGVRPDDRVAVQVEKSVAALALTMAAVMAGGVILPLNPGYTDAEVAYFLGDAEPAAFVCDPARAEALAAYAGGAALLTLDAAGAGTLAQAAAAATAMAAAPRGADDMAAILYTSGTTGRSKGAVLTHENLASNARTLVTTWGISDADTLIHALPIFHTHGLFVATNTALASGAGMIFHPKFDAEAVLADLDRATMLMGVPTFYTRLLEQEALTREACAGMRLFISGSAPMLPETHDAWSERTGHAILERYGMTETGMLTSNPLDGPRRPGAVGLPLADVSVRIVDPETGAALAEGEIGMIEVRGPNVFREYWRMPEKTAAEKRPDGWFVTGDLGRIEADGYVAIVGRAKDLIISGGFNVYPKEVEEAIDALPGVTESAVFGAPHPDFGEGVCAAIMANGVTEDMVSGRLKDAVARYKQPRFIRFVDALPRNAMGKVQKTALAAEYKDAFAPG